MATKLKKVVLIFFAALLAVIPLKVNAEMQQLGPNLFVAGIPSDQFQYFAAPEGEGRQRSANWCWAASIQMVLNYHGVFVRQEDIVQKVYGDLIDKPAGPEQILYALNGWAPDATGRYSQIYAVPYQINGPTIVRDLAYRWPLIVGLQNQPIGHAYVLTGVTYSVDQYNNPIFHSAILRDPWPSNPSRQEISWAEFNSRLMFITRVYVQRM